MRLYSAKESIPERFFSVERRSGKPDYPVHGHTFFEMEYILKGKGQYIIDGVSYEVRPDTLFFLTPARIHEIHWQDAEFVNIMFDGQYFPSDTPLFLSDATCPPCLTPEGKDADFFRSVLSVLLDVRDTNRSYAFLLLQCILHQYLQCAHGMLSPVPDDPVSRAILFLLENFRSPLRLEDVAGEVGLSANYFSDLFSRHTGTCFKRYLDNLRFSYAANLLSFTDLTVTEVSYSSGFEDYANFMRRFRARFGCTPQQFRKAERK